MKIDRAKLFITLALVFSGGVIGQYGAYLGVSLWEVVIFAFLFGCAIGIAATCSKNKEPQ